MITALDVIAGESTWSIDCDNAVDWLRKLPDNSVHCWVTSPPYAFIRSYLDKDHPAKAKEIGSEPTIAEYIAAIVAVFAEMFRVLRPDGICWLNLGDTYHIKSGGSDGATLSKHKEGKRALTNGDHIGRRSARPTEAAVFKAGDAYGVPWRVLFALQAAGWIHRGDFVWAKTAPMPETLQGTRWERCVRKKKPMDNAAMRKNKGHDRQKGDGNGKNFESFRPATQAEWELCPGCKQCEGNGGFVLRTGSWRPTRGHEPFFQLVKSMGYYADQFAVLTPPKPATVSRDQYSRVLDQPEEQYGVKHNHETVCTLGANPRSWAALGPEGCKATLCKACKKYWPKGPPRAAKTKNRTTLYKPCTCGANDWVAHYAAYPSGLIEPLVSVATAAGGCCSQCGAQAARCITDLGSITQAKAEAGYPELFSETEFDVKRSVPEIGGWRLTCDCNAGSILPPIVGDPFNGSGTSALVARRLNCRFIGCDLSEDYCSIARHRVTEDMPLFNSGTVR